MGRWVLRVVASFKYIEAANVLDAQLKWYGKGDGTSM